MSLIEKYTYLHKKFPCDNISGVDFFKGDGNAW